MEAFSKANSKHFSTTAGYCAPNTRYALLLCILKPKSLSSPDGLLSISPAVPEVIVLVLPRPLLLLRLLELLLQLLLTAQSLGFPSPLIHLGLLAVVARTQPAFSLHVPAEEVWVSPPAWLEGARSGVERELPVARYSLFPLLVILILVLFILSLGGFKVERGLWSRKGWLIRTPAIGDRRRL